MGTVLLQSTRIYSVLRVVLNRGRGRWRKVGGECMERDPITGVWGQSPLSGGLGGKAPQKPKLFLFQDITQDVFISTIFDKSDSCD